MKKAILSFALIMSSILILAQAPEFFNYQVVVRDGSTNDPLMNQNVTFKMSILKGSSSGASQYSELHSANTGVLGIVNLVIGNGTGKTGDITTIDWGTDTYYLKIEFDKTGGSEYVEMGTVQLLSVPYAMHAKSVTSYDEIDPQFNLSPANGITSSNISDWNTAYTWGNHALQGYLTNITETDPEVGSNSTDFLSKWDGTALISSTVFDNGKIGIGTTNPTGYLEVTDKGELNPYNLIILGQTITPNRLRLSSGTNYGIISVGSEMDESKGMTIRHSSGYVGMGTSDPSTKLEVNGVITATGGSSTNWNSAYSWGNHATGGYLKSYTETDPNFLASPAYGITSGNITNWNSTQWSEITSIPAGFSDGVDNDTWTNNTKSSAGIVTAGGSNYNTLWRTDGSGNPLWGSLAASDIPDLDWSKITTGKPSTLAGYGIADGVNITSNQTIDGNKTFTGTTTVPAPVNSTDAATKAYVDSQMPPHYIGEVYGGGIVFYVYDNGRHGLIAATTDQSNGINWHYVGSYINTRARADGIGAGLKNTAIIIANENPINGIAFAATVCNEYSVTMDGVTYGDWYLPSKYELNLLHSQKEVVGGFTTTDYWSSTEIDNVFVWYQAFYGGWQMDMDKGGWCSVRAIRAF